ncbi:T9SS type A sorting domain-containing protein [Owenweeksia hongkongensis]|uniref:T9SS type A sorting domain-containing protein n=1 Tax=Owenweeksia hongkongensis TaxID=253245 RepID=UPI003A8D1246
MKTRLLLFMSMLAFYGYAQNVAPEQQEAYEKLSPTEFEQIKKVWETKKEKAALSKKAGGPVSQRMSHADVAYTLFQGVINAVFSPFAPDSTYIQDFGSPSAIGAHGYGQTFDPTSAGFGVMGQDYFTQNNSYTIDTIYVGARYRTSSSISGLTGDTLQVAVVMGDTLDDNVWRVGIGYNAGTYPGQNRRINVLPPRYTGNSAVGTPGSLDAPNLMIIKYALKATDTAVNYIKVVPPAPIQVAGGDKIGILNTFIPGQSYDPNTQKYYVSGGRGDVNNISYLRYQNTSTSDNNSYFLEPLTLGSPSAGISFTLFSNTRYGAWTGNDAFRNEYVSPSATRAYLIDFWVTGTSTVGLDENDKFEPLSIYPNPSTGKVSLKVSTGGDYNLQLMDLTGKLVHTEALAVNSSEEFIRDFSYLPRGIYLVTIESGFSKQTIKLSLH